MQIDILTLFPEQFITPFSSSIIKRAIDKKLVTINTVNIRDFGYGKHKQVDDKPYGGGVGMILKVDILHKALKSMIKQNKKEKTRIILLDARGSKFSQKSAKRLTKYNRLILICGHYEGFDERILKFTDEQISIGPYVLTGGELPAMVIVDSVTRLLPGVLLKKVALETESFSENSLEYPQYTRPSKYENMSVPKILIMGDHKKIETWKKKKMKPIND